MDEEKDQKESFSFLQETIKRDRGPRHFFKIVLMMLVLGVIFGIAASTSFVVIKPWMESMFQEDEVVSIPGDVLEDESDGLDDGSSDESGDGAGDNSGDISTDSDSGDDSSDDSIADAMDEMKDEILQELIDENSSTDMELTDFEKIYEELYEVAMEASKSTVTVRAEYDAAEEEALVLSALEGNENVAVRSVTGLIVASTSTEILVFAPSDILEDAEVIYVKFNDGTEFAAEIKAEETILGYAVLTVKSYLVEEEAYEVATLGNSLIVNQGSVAIAIGNQFDYEDGLGYGVISSTKNQLNLVDGCYDLLSTDIPVAVDGTGILINTSGQVIGIINTNLTDETAVDAIGISDLKSIIEALSNGESVPYLGIKSTEVTEEIAQMQSMPLGIYVQSVEMYSPAMYAGIKNGDIITSINGTTVKTTSVYQTQLLKLSEGEVVTIVLQRKGASDYIEMEIEVTVGSKD